MKKLRMRVVIMAMVLLTTLIGIGVLFLLSSKSEQTSFGAEHAEQHGNVSASTVRNH